MALAGLAAVEVQGPVSKPTGLVIVETDGCFVDGIEVASGATVGHRTLRVVDMGKIAATFVNVRSGKAIRLAPKHGVRSLAFTYAPDQDHRYKAQLEGYRVMPESELFVFQDVSLNPPLASLLSNPDARAACSRCGEEVINQREMILEGEVVCRSCAGGSYFTVASAPTRQESAAPGQVGHS
jgi:formylmethanofuran dehydrogenase subunit E